MKRLFCSSISKEMSSSWPLYEMPPQSNQTHTHRYLITDYKLQSKTATGDKYTITPVLVNTSTYINSRCQQVWSMTTCSWICIMPLKQKWGSCGSWTNKVEWWLFKRRKKGTAVDQELSGGCEGAVGKLQTQATAWYSLAPTALAYTHV